ncbi:hypothetical protein [Cupriavidus sp. DL-D2]|uniref:hypothetical protein n=1 Tax=Cupriavidus sp. DL-D2 TaxID=3144974 RepID=UPI0032146969
MKSKLKLITITRAEGPSSMCGKPQTAATFHGADWILHRWSSTAPEKGGYDKCDFRIEWENGMVYEGRYDLKHWRVEHPSLSCHVLGFIEFSIGKACPHHMRQERYEAYVQQNLETKEQCQAFLDQCEFEA